MMSTEIIQKTANYVNELLHADSSGHDWWHIERVWKMAIKLAEGQPVNLFVVELAALLHDIDDWKFNEENSKTLSRATQWMHEVNLDTNTIEHVTQIIKEMCFKGANVATTMTTLEGMIVQDADRLDAIGAIGIARAFAYGGSRGRAMYDPDIPSIQHDSFEAYKKNQGSAINHFYEKLFLLKDRMNTNLAHKIAEQRHQVMLDFVQQFMREWNGEA
ncbi:MAG: HD domain-containing protein [Gammaproteobacteria bacterium]